MMMSQLGHYYHHITQEMYQGYYLYLSDLLIWHKCYLHITSVDVTGVLPVSLRPLKTILMLLTYINRYITYVCQTLEMQSH